MRKRSQAGLIKLALVYAIQDRDGYAAGDPGVAGLEAKALADEFRALLSRKFGSVTANDALAADVASGKVKRVRIHDLVEA